MLRQQWKQLRRQWRTKQARREAEGKSYAGDDSDVNLQESTWLWGLQGQEPSQRVVTKSIVFHPRRPSGTGFDEGSSSHSATGIPIKDEFTEYRAPEKHPPMGHASPCQSLIRRNSSSSTFPSFPLNAPTRPAPPSPELVDINQVPPYHSQGSTPIGSPGRRASSQERTSASPPLNEAVQGKMRKRDWWSVIGEDAEGGDSRRKRRTPDSY